MAVELSTFAVSGPRIRRHVLTGIAAGLVLVAVYIGILSLAQGVTHALEQAEQLWYWVMLIATGFGVQVGLFSFIRSALRQWRAAATASVAASGGVSAGSMAACCAHHLSDVLPLLGLSGLALFLTKYQLLFLLAGVLSNAVGITIMLETIQRYNLCPVVAEWKPDMGLIKKALILSSGLILVGTFLITWRQGV